MRIWDLPVHNLCRQHLLGEHRELHALWVVLTQHKKGYSHHPETLRWEGKLQALYNRHDVLVSEMKKRGYAHHSPLDKRLTKGESDKQDLFLASPDEQVAILRKKGCTCYSEK